MSAPVITATPTIQSGLVVRWRRSTEGPAILSASRHGVMIHGDVFLHDLPDEWIEMARRAHNWIKAGWEDGAQALATHRHARRFGDLVPIGDAS